MLANDENVKSKNSPGMKRAAALCPTGGARGWSGGTRGWRRRRAPCTGRSEWPASSGRTSCSASPFPLEASGAG